MTQVQVDYQKFLETQRHNKEMEKVSRAEAATNKMQALNKEREVVLAEDFQPWKRMESATKTEQQMATAWSKMMGGIASLFS